MKEKIILGMPLKNGEMTIEKAIQSFLNQEGLNRDKLLLIANDNSSDGSNKILDKYAEHPEIEILSVDLGKAYLVRNYLNYYIRSNYKECICIGRLDADDVLASNSVLAKVEAIYNSAKFDVLLTSNKQRKNGEILKWINKPTKKLLEDSYLLNRLYRMSISDFSAELPSCNTFIRPSVQIEYPAKDSAEDHWFTVELLRQKKVLSIQIEEEIIYSIYDLSGNLTIANKSANIYRQSREELYEYFKKCLENDRQV